MSKLNFNETFSDVLLKLSEGNPGAMTTLFEIMKAKNDDEIKYLDTFLVIDTMELYGSNLYMLWNDCCNRDINKVLEVIDGYQLGKITDIDINERIKNIGYGKSFDDLLEKSDKE